MKHHIGFDRLHTKLSAIGLLVAVVSIHTGADVCIDESDFKSDDFGSYSAKIIFEKVRNEISIALKTVETVHQDVCPNQYGCYLLTHIDERQCQILTPNGQFLELKRYYISSEEILTQAIIGRWSYDNCWTQSHAFNANGTAHYWQEAYGDERDSIYSSYEVKGNKIIELSHSPADGFSMTRFEILMNFDQSAFIGMREGVTSRYATPDNRKRNFFQKKCE